MHTSPFKLLAASLAASSFALASGCSVDATSADADESSEDVGDSEDELSIVGRAFVGKFEWSATASGAFMDIETIELRANGTYSAKVEATLVNPAVRCVRTPCTLPETGRWTAYKVAGQTKIRLRPTTSKARVYGAALANDRLTLSRLGAKTTLFREALLTCDNVRCAAGTHCELKGLNGKVVPVCTPDAPKPACKKTGCSGQICADQDIVTTCEFRPEYACYQQAECKRQADGECGFTQTPALDACLAPKTPPAAACKRTGCSGQICADRDIATTCEFRPEYACYQQAECSRQANGQCGFTQTPALSACLGSN